MCRHVAYIGPGISLTELTHELPHSLQVQSYAARELLTGVVCADGFGVAWYNDGEPGRYASGMPIWSDENLPSFGKITRSPIVMAAVRNGSEAGTNHPRNSAPFVRGKMTFSHNGFIRELPRWESWFHEQLDVRPLGQTDSEWMLLLVESFLDEGLAVAVQRAARLILAKASDLDVSCQLNWLISDGEVAIATRTGLGAQNSLYLLNDGSEFPDAFVVASEPLYDDPLWEKIGENALLVLQAGAPPVRLTI